jgi:hypothetical protein
MNDKLFDVVFFGILQTGKDKETVMQNMATLFKTEPQKLVPYFAGGRKIIKGKINAGAAEKYKAALENVGLVIRVEAHQGAEETEKHTAQSSNSAASDHKQAARFNTGNLTMAEVGADILEHPVTPVARKIDDISDISMADAGADVLVHPVKVKALDIADISDLTMAEPGTDVLDHPKQVIPQPIEDISDITIAAAGADIIENPKPKEKAPVPDISELSFD